MKFCFNIESLEKIDFSKFELFLKRYEENIRVEANGSEILKKLIFRNKDYETNLTIRIFKRENYDKKELDEELTEYDKILQKCKYDLEIYANSENEIKVVIYLAVFIARNTNMIFNDFILGDKLKNFDKDDLDKMLKEYKIHFKYYNKVKTLENEKKPFSFSGLYSISLIISSIMASLLLIFMILVCNINNFLILSLPFLLVLGVYTFIPINKTCTNNIISKKIVELNYEKSKEICAIYNMRNPKMPSVKTKQLNYKQLFINLIAYLIGPALIGGSILITVNLLLTGILVILAPWLILILIRIFCTDKAEQKIKSEVFDLINKCLDNPKIEKIEGLKFQISEIKKFSWEISVIGYRNLELSKINSLDNNNENIVLSSLTFNYCINWEELENVLIKQILLEFIYKNQKNKRINNLKAITLGFEDGLEQILLENNNIL